MRLVKNLRWVLPGFAATFLVGTVAFPANDRSPFYRLPNSAFSSGTELTERLRIQTEHQVSHTWMKVFNFQTSSHTKNKSANSGWVPRGDLICASDLQLEAVTRSLTPVRSSMDWSAAPIETLNGNTSVTILETQLPWLKISTRSGVGFISADFTQVRDGHWGAAVARRSSKVFALPNSLTRTLTNLNAGDRARISGFTGEWLQLQIPRGRTSLTGYSSARDFLTRLDFAQTVRLKNENKNTAVVRIIPGKIILHDGRTVAWTQVENFQADDSLCLARSSQTSLRESPSDQAQIVARVPAQSPLKNQGQLEIRWGQVQLAKHGPVWWQMPSWTDREKQDPRLSDENSAASEIVVDHAKAAAAALAVARTTLTTEQLFRRKVTRFLRYEYTNETLYLVSAGGLFRSRDGHLWQPIAGFSDQNYPLAITKGGWIIAGSYVSTNRSQSFEPFVKWERILKLVAHLGWPSPKRVGIFNVSANENVNGEDSSADANTRVMLGLDLGKQRHLTIATEDWGQSWGIASTSKVLRTPGSSPLAPDRAKPLDLPPLNPKYKWLSKPATALTGL